MDGVLVGAVLVGGVCVASLGRQQLVAAAARGFAGARLSTTVRAPTYRAAAGWWPCTP
ncbi:hypothetical protein [Streptomyces sp. SP18CS02]|uniref:hypothetical protein n=1 Tax=Streptomyces sp. SP18CS02 TaxID=3002531 RepID=UPI002E78D646|nr:hypothetical protein [Streptomyces sp. SP18CS02]MEE1753352.1 hypothetical protein [Streptomyces sp. SP18CS02]